MYTIGQISKLVNISANALRYYDEISLLKPAGQDKINGYRYYIDAQIKELLKIQELKYYGFSLNEIKEILRADEHILSAALKKKLVFLEKNYEYDGMRIQIIKEKLGGDSMYKDKLIMLVECVSFERMILKEVLLSHGFTNFVECSNGKEAIEKYDELKPHLVITSIVMPETDGLYAFMKIKEKYSDAKFIFCTSMCQLHIVYDAVINGCVDFIPKPLNTERIIISAINALEKKTKTEINTKNTDIINKEIIKGTEEFVKKLALNQEEVDCFLDYARKTEPLSSAELNEYLKRLLNRCEQIGNNEAVDDEVDYVKVNLNRVMQNDINKQLVSAIKNTHDITDVTADFVWTPTIKDYIISNPNYIFMPINCDGITEGCLCYPDGMDFKADDFISSFIKLEKNITTCSSMEVKKSGGYPIEKMSSYYILSTFYYKQKNIVTMFLSTNVYK